MKKFRAEEAVMHWLASDGSSTVVANKSDFPDILVEEGTSIVGYEVLAFSGKSAQDLSRRVTRGLYLGRLAVLRDAIKSFHIVIACNTSDDLEVAKALIVDIDRHPSTVILVGVIVYLEDEEQVTFQPMHVQS
jgi:hypothetical protein